MSNQPSNEDLKVRLAEAEAAVKRLRQSELDSGGSRWRVDKAHLELERAERDQSGRRGF